MKWFPECSGECCVCACGGNCLVGNGDDGFSPATNEQILERLKNGNYPNYRRTMINELAMRGIVYDTNPTEKMTDNEIIKALECCRTPKCSNCVECPQRGLGTDCLGELIENTINLINRQQAEIDILIRKKETLRDEIAEKQAEIERLKEFATAKCEDCAGCTSWKCDCANIETLAKSEARKEFAERLKKIFGWQYTTARWKLLCKFIDKLLEEMEREDNA